MRGGAPAAAMFLVLAACATDKPAAPPPPTPPPPPPQHASYDWHVLVVAPFGSVVKEVPLKLHEVLLFKDQESDSTEAGECYASDESPPTFLERTPTLLLCFKHDHLSRIEAVVMLPKDEAAKILSNACALWHKNAGEAAADERVSCAGSDGTVHYDARAEEASDGNEVPLTLKLEPAAPSES